ncbi:MAG TPA: hypothetical protein VK843_00760 [Planctomycetota bacterium]|nr:hypothetical protein [Planctomycetota bacterium]
MKAIHSTLLALCVASCRATDSANPRPLGPGSRVVIPGLVQPKSEDPLPLLVSTPPVVSAPAVEEPPQKTEVLEQRASTWHKLATALREGWTRAVVAAKELAAAQQAPTNAMPEPAVVNDEPPPATGESNATEAAYDPASLLNEGPRLKAEAERALAEDRLDDAIELTRQLRALQPRENARRLVGQSRFDEARAELEQGLADSPDRPELLMDLGTLDLTLAAADRSEFLQEALEVFARAGNTPEALLGHSRAACALGRFELALDSAQRAMVLLDSQPSRRLAISPAPEIVLARAGSQVLRKLRKDASAAAGPLFLEIQSALELRIAHASTDATAHAALVELLLDAGKVFEAEQAAWVGLNSSPGDADLTELFARAAKSCGDTAELLAAFSRFRDRFPYQPLGYWYPAFEFFENSVNHVTLPLFEGSGKDQLDRAEKYFGLVRSLDARYTQSCLQYEALCRALAGWQLFGSKRIEPARAAFKSMNDVAEGSVALDPGSDVDPRWAGRLESGAKGLEKIAEHYRDVTKDLAMSAAVYADLADLVPGDPRRARDAAVSAEQAGLFLDEAATSLEKAARGETTDETALKKLRKDARVKEKEIGLPKELERYRTAASAKRKQSDACFAQSWKRYQDAIRLAPTDVQLACNAAKLAIYHIPRDLPVAEQLLRDAIRLVTAQIESDPANDSLKHAHADALQFQGVIELEFKDDPDLAVQLFQQAISADPQQRPGVVDQLLPKAEAAAAKKKAVAASPPAETPSQAPKNQP